MYTHYFCILAIYIKKSPQFYHSQSRSASLIASLGDLTNGDIASKLAKTNGLASCLNKLFQTMILKKPLLIDPKTTIVCQCMHACMHARYAKLFFIWSLTRIITCLQVGLCNRWGHLIDGDKICGAMNMWGYEYVGTVQHLQICQTQTQTLQNDLI